MDQVQAMYFLASSWLKVKPETIKNCWRHTKLLNFKETLSLNSEVLELPSTALPLEPEIVAQLNELIPSLPGNLNNEVTKMDELDMETDENEMVLFPTSIETLDGPDHELNGFDVIQE